MAWSTFGWTIKPGVAHRWSLAWAGNAWVGAQFMQAYPLSAVIGEYPNWHMPEAELFTFDQSVSHIYGGVSHTYLGHAYNVTVRNNGPTETWYTIYGGGVA